MKPNSSKHGADSRGRQSSKITAPITGGAAQHLASERVARALVGLGERYLSFRGQRLHLPADVGHRIGQRLNAPWMAICWMNECVRLVPIVLWPAYVKAIRAELGGKLSSRSLSMLVEQAAVAIRSDRRGRVELPKHVVEKAKLTDTANCDVVLVANRFWVEVWGIHTWEAMQQSLVAQTSPVGQSPPINPSGPNSPK